MTIGVAPSIGQIKTGDTAELYGSLRIDEQPVTSDQVAQVNFVVQKPDGTRTTNLGVVLDDGRGFFRQTDTSQAGEYKVQAQFTMVSGEVRSVMSNFSVVDPFADTPTETVVVGNQTFPLSTLNVKDTSEFPTSGSIVPKGVTGVVAYTGTTPTSFTGCSGGTGTAVDGGAVLEFLTPSSQDIITEAVWLRLEDIFDSIEGGPWLRDKTLAHFDENKIAAFISEALMDINLQMPPTQFDIAFFTNWAQFPGDNANMPLLVKGVLCLTIRHLMRSYAEQYTPQGAQVVWPDRTRYTQIWQGIYEVEYADYIQAVRLWKRTTLNLGHSAVSIFNKSGRVWPYSNQRARGAYRGYY